jgi:hypothetical protein
MPDVALRGMPDQLHKELESAASRNNRSLDEEILTRLRLSVHGRPVDPKVHLDRIRRRNEAFGPIDLSDETIRELRDAGRP